MPQKQTPAQVLARSRGRERSVPVAGRDPYPSDSSVVLAQPKGQSRGKMKNQGWNMRPRLAEPRRIYFGLNAQSCWRSSILPYASNSCISPKMGTMARGDTLNNNFHKLR